MKEEKCAHSDEAKAQADEWSNKLIGAAIEVHRHLGPGLLEGAYEECLCRELDLRGIPYLRQHYLNIEYKGVVVENAYKLDVFVADLVVVELKSVAKLEPIHEAQLLLIRRLSGLFDVMGGERQFRPLP